MAKMLPREVAEGTTSDAERLIYRRIRDDLSDDWLAIHSLGMTKHSRKPWAEIDFVLIGPPGVFCLEVKGGTISRKDGLWRTTNRRGRTSQLKESPVAQVASAAAALHKYLASHLSVLAKSMTGYGVVIPDSVCGNCGPDIEPRMFYDGHDAASGFDRYLARLTAHWIEQSRILWSRTPVSLSVLDRQAIQRLLIGDFDLRPSLRSSMRAVRDDFICYTDEQAAVLRALGANRRVLVQGGAGTGKTVLAVEEAVRLAGQEQRTLLMCYNRRLAADLRMRADQTERLTIRTFHGLVAEIIKEAGLSGRIPDAEPDDLFRVILPDLCTEALVDGKGGRPFDALILDEGQDILSSAYVDVLDMLLEGGIAKGLWRAFLDPIQDLFSGVDLSGLGRVVDAGPVRYQLTMNCRNARSIALTASLMSGVPQAEVLKVDGGVVKTIFVSDDLEQRRKVSQVVSGLIHKGLDPRTIVILSSRKRENSCLRQGLVGNCGPLVDPDDRGKAGAAAIGFATIGSFKGLESDAVLLVDLHGFASEIFAAEAYVGSTRAHGYLAIFVPESERDAWDEIAARFGRQLAQR